MLVLLQYKYVGFPQGMMLASLQWTCHIPTAFLLVLLQWTRVRFLLDFSGLAAINTRHFPTGFLLVVLQEARFMFLLDSGWSCCKKHTSNFRWVVTASVVKHKHRISAWIIPISLHHCDLWSVIWTTLVLRNEHVTFPRDSCWLYCNKHASDSYGFLLVLLQ